MTSRSGDSILISEIFGPTIQGEGPALGQHAVFVRTAGCPVGCSWCDTKYSWDAASRRGTSHTVRAMDVDEVAREVDLRLKGTSGIVVVTGGEPLSQAGQVHSLAAHPALAGRAIHLETAGVHVPSVAIAETFDLIVVSPKLAHSGVARDTRINVAALLEFDRHEAWFKFVVRDPSDLDEIAELQRDLGLQRIMVMPEGKDASTLLARSGAIVDEAIARGWAITTRLHILLWGDAPGR